MKKSIITTIVLLIMCHQALATVPGKIFPSDGAAYDNFCYAVSISGEFAIVGAIYDDDRGSDSGSAYIYQQKNNVWEKVQKIVPTDGAASDNFGSAVSISGDYAIIGSRYDDDKASNSGSAYIYKKNPDDVWEFVSKLIPNDGAASDYFGHAVAIFGDVAIIGAYADEGKGSNAGSAYIYQRNGDTWSYITEIFASDGAASDYFGYAVSLTNDYAIIGAHNDDDKGDASGSVYIFQRNGTYWTQITKLVPSDGLASDYFGYAVSISGDYAIIGANGDDEKSSDSGSAYIYQRSGNYWNLVEKLVPEDGASSDYFGYAVSISGDYAVVGACYDDDKGGNSGSAYIYQNVNNNWQQIKKLVAPDGAGSDYFGYAVALSEKYAIVGAYAEDARTTDSGSAYIYQNINITGQIKDPDNKPISGVSFQDYPDIEPSEDQGYYTISEFVPSDNIMPQKTDHAFYPKYLDLTSPNVSGKNTSIQWEGHSVSVSDNSAIVGLPEYSLHDYNKGAANIYTKSNDLWTKTVTLEASDAQINDRFGDAVAIFGNYAIVGAPFADDYTISNTGAAYLFAYQNSSWRQIQKLMPETTSENQQFGFSLAIGEKYAFVSAKGTDNHNAVHVFVREDTNWKFVQMISQPTNAGTGFACDLGLSNDWLAIGAWDTDQAGAVYVYQLQVNEWHLAQRLISDTSELNDQFGASVAISNEYLIVGAMNADARGESSGAAYIFQQDDDMIWHQIQKMVPQDGAPGDLFGADVAICDDYAVIGAYQDDDNGTASGSVYLINRSSDRWLFTQKLFAPHGEKNDHFGFSISISQTDAVVGAPLHDGDGIDSGKTYMFPITHYTISGIIRDIHGKAIPGVKVSFTNSGISVYTNIDGFFRAKLYEGWEGKACPQGMGYEYVPSFVPYEPLNQHYLNQDFTGIRFSIAGKVRTEDNQPLSGVTLFFSPLNIATQTNDTGDYIQEIDYLWDGILKPEKPGYTFDPEFKSFDMLTSNYYDVDFIAKLANFSISGIIRDTSGQAISGAQVCFSGIDDCVISSTSGFYSAAVPFKWTGTISASKPGYVIPSENHAYTDVNSNIENQDFSAMINTYVISGKITNARTGEPMADIQLTGDGLQTVYTDETGTYHIEAIYGYTGMIHAQKQGYVFSPEYCPVESLDQDLPNVDIHAEQKTFLLSGTILNANNSPVSGITIYFSGQGSTVSNSEGQFSYQVPYGWTGKANLFKLNYAFDPPYLTLETVTQDIDNIDFVANTSLTPNLYVEPDSHIVSHNAGNVLFTIQVSPISITWQADTPDNWIQISMAAGMLSIDYFENTSYINRTANITVRTNTNPQLIQAITLVQEGKPKPVIEKPDWQVVTSQYEYQQTLTGIVMDDQETTKNNSEDILAAFSGNTCVGTASPIDTSYGSRFFLQIWSNEPESKIEFRYYDSVEQQIYTNLLYPVTFQSDASLGSVVEPHVILIAQNIVQIPLTANWNWISLNAIAEDMSLNSLFGTLNGKGERFVTQSGYSEYHVSSNTWSGLITYFNPLEMGMLRVKEPITLQIMAIPVNINETVLSLQQNWNWISYLPTVELSLDEALNSINGKANQIVSQNGYSYYVDNDGWYGSLNTLQPGHGYKIKMISSADLKYPTTFSPSARTLTRSRKRSTVRTIPPTILIGCLVDPSLYENQFTLTGIAVMNQISQEDEDDVIVAKCGSSCRSYGQLVDTPSGKRYFMQIWGNYNDTITLEFHDASAGKAYVLEKEYSFIPYNSIGSIEEPEVLSIFSIEDQIAELQETIAGYLSTIESQEETISLKDTLINSLQLTQTLLDNEITTLLADIDNKITEINYWKQIYADCQDNCEQEMGYVVNLKQGWNLVSTPPYEGTIETTPADMIIAMYYYSTENNTYVSTETLIPEKGHWIKVVEDCELRVVR